MLRCHYVTMLRCIDQCDDVAKNVLLDVYSVLEKHDEPTTFAVCPLKKTSNVHLLSKQKVY